MSTEQHVTEREQPDELTFAEWQEQLRAGRLFGHACDSCGRVTSFPRGACDSCGSRDLEPVELPTTGEVYSVTRVQVAPEGFESGYRLALVDLEGAHVLARIDGEAEIGETVAFTGVFEGNGDPAPVFEPADR